VGSDRIEDIVANYNGRAFGFASRNFYAQFLAVLDVENNARRYFGDIRLDPAPEFIEVKTDAFIEAQVFARSLGISLEQLRKDNPALLPIVWGGTKRIPRDFPVKVRRSFASDPGQVLAQIPAGDKFAVQTPDITYVVARGDSLSVIASRFNTTVARLVSLNQLASRHQIQIGQRLLLPQDGVDGQQLIAAVDTPTPRPADGVYSVRQGDTLSRIATRFDVAETEVMRLNNISDPHLIFPGQKLRLPAQEGAPQLAAGGDSPAAPRGPIAATSQPAAPVEVAASEEPVTPTEPLQLAQVKQLLPPAAVLPDNQVLGQPVTTAESEAKAVESTLSVAETNEQLVEALLADPSDYSVASDGTIEIQPSETLGHYADWLGQRSMDIRRLNNMSFREPVIIGERLKLDFADVSASEFEVKRREFHVQKQQSFFSRYRIQNVDRYQVAANDNIGSIARQRYATPYWLLRQYNPALDFNRVQIGEEIVFPLLEPVD
jgi:membrane-bound lytic murein transglycosylase D